MKSNKNALARVLQADLQKLIEFGDSLGLTGADEFHFGLEVIRPLHGDLENLEGGFTSLDEFKMSFEEGLQAAENCRFGTNEQKTRIKELVQVLRSRI